MITMLLLEILLFPPMFMINRKIESILRVIGRVGEKKTEEQIEIFKSVLEMVNSLEEKYISRDYFQLCLNGEDYFIIEKNKNKLEIETKKKRKKYNKK